MPHLLNFMKDNGTLLTNDHTILISHTAGGILSSLTGLYPDRHGQCLEQLRLLQRRRVSRRSRRSFKYWTDPVDDDRARPAAEHGHRRRQERRRRRGSRTRAPAATSAPSRRRTPCSRTPAPARAATSPRCSAPARPSATEADASNAARRDRGGQGTDRLRRLRRPLRQAAAASATRARTRRPDLLPDEPGGYAGYKALFGAKYVNPAITRRRGRVNDLDGQPDHRPVGQPGLPGLRRDVGRDHARATSRRCRRPGSRSPTRTSPTRTTTTGPATTTARSARARPGYVAAAAALRRRVRRVLRPPRGRRHQQEQHAVRVHRRRGRPLRRRTHPQTDCDWREHVPCVYGAEPGRRDQRQHRRRCSTSRHRGLHRPNGSFNFTVHGDDAPTFYLNGQPRRDDRAGAQLRAGTRRTSRRSTRTPATTAEADGGHGRPVEMKALHMYTAGDPLRDPTFAYFGEPGLLPDRLPGEHLQDVHQPGRSPGTTATSSRRSRTRGSASSGRA